jgi:DNA polymerase/3'-5' exonuclease PolX
MADEYYLDFQKYTLKTWQGELTEAPLLPSRQILKEDLEDRFKILRENGISNLQELMDALNTPKKAREFSSKTRLPEDYVLVLRREVMSLKPSPVNLDKFPGVDPDALKKLQGIGIKTTLRLFKRVKTPQKREELANELGVGLEEILELTKLTDLSRVKWVGPVFARMFLDSGMDTVEKLSKAEATPFYEKLVEINQEKKYTKARFVESDLELCIEFTRKVPQVIEY